jgi:hypothetical protein
VDAIHRNEVDAINRYGWTPSIGIGGRHHSVRPIRQLMLTLLPLIAHAQSWMKLCEKATATISGYEGRTVCLT